MAQHHIGYVYKITNTNDNREYVGSSNDVRRRFINHKITSTDQDIRCYYLPLYIAMRALGSDIFSIHVLETVEYTDKSELLHRERHWIEKLNPAFNGVKPIETKQECDERVKRWHVEHKEHVKNYKAEYYQANKTKIDAKTTEYYQQNKERLKAYARAYGKSQPKIQCECGSVFQRSKVKQHSKTKKHIDWVQMMEFIESQTE